MTLDASIVVCTYRRPALLGTCLRSIIDQHNPYGQCEVLVIDNCRDRSGEATAMEAVPRFAERRMPLRYVVEPRTGIAFARNRALDDAAKPLICFIDDDERALPGWLGHLLRPFAEHGVAIVTGEVEPDFGTSPRPDWLLDEFFPLYSCKWWGSDGESRFLLPGEAIFEGNCAFRRASLGDRRFDTELGRSGNHLVSNEGAIFTELIEGGAAAYFSLEATVSHLIHKERLDKRWLLQRAFFEGVSVHLARRKSGRPQEVMGVQLQLRQLAHRDLDSFTADELRNMVTTYREAGYAFATNMF